MCQFMQHIARGWWVSIYQADHEKSRVSLCLTESEKVIFFFFFFFFFFLGGGGGGVKRAMTIEVLDGNRFLKTNALMDHDPRKHIFYVSL